ncbi:2-dehydropantoate 2-reductase [Bacillus glycinifermentans]|uniref:2-dehydropantoate 2-reductase n=1 Tax=Bacillus glycinifermentans TaxID=1664069 RepID=A0A0J6H636_9BACI|nr:2-dehydropantoate 2-reductase N-terminal domain-containing protein [Bacillus glycinifermentans]ATH93952.1 ketopantoate reductase family protein [Bacillus glycinifermentans]KMM55204.1 2-dehydropantoate 2-reductase [Bacillus glycinifermentans]KRT94106.1 2-dehydropantoate 2-reductase [Bacillus glycinifermentans]MEC0488000.1 2-dehydropantoate 2-reductase N-terminal domain-containing protein [Bacillus glycinifermentans]MEC0496510.1 2-dehydropantoate 2-reductase N-terminal domain-containing prote
MKILVYGAGVLGSYLAHVLVRGGHDVTVLARGKRAEELERNGVVIRHYFQFKTTVDPVRVIRTLETDESYDLVFVVMKYTDFRSVLPVLAANRSRCIVLVGNNADARGMLNELQEMSLTEKQVAFGFQVSGGSRVNGRVVCIRGGGQMVLGGLDGSIPFRPLLEKAFEKVKYKLTFHEDMDAWLKGHIVPILALNAALFAKEGKMKEIARDKKLLTQIIAAMDEGFGVLEALDYTITPANQATFVRKHKRMAYLAIKIYYMLPFAKLVDGSFEEMAALHDSFGQLKQKANIPTPHFDNIGKQFIHSKRSV